MSVKKLTPLWSTLVAGGLVLTGCGGGGGGGGSTTESPTEPTVTNVQLSGRVVDGYLRYATVCLDLDGNGYCQMTDEPTTSTLADGSYTLTATPTQQAHPNYGTADLIVFGGQDSDTLLDFNGKLKAPFESGTGTAFSVNITPLTTMVAAVKKSTTGMTATQAKEKVALTLNLTTDKLDVDPVAAAKTGDATSLKAALQVQKTIEVMAKAAGGDQKAATENLFNAIAAKVATVTSASTSAATGLATAITQATGDTTTAALMGAAAVAVADKATKVAELVETVDVSNTASDDAIAAIALTVEATKDAVEEATDLANTGLVTVTVDSLKIERLKNMLVSAGYIGEVNASTILDAEAAGVVIESAMTYESVSGAISDADIADTAINTTGTLAAIRTALLAKIALLEDIADSLSIVATVDGVLATDKTATVADAKNMINQLRDTIYTFANFDDMTGELNVSSALGKHIDDVKTYIKPALDDVINNDINVTVTAIGDMAKAFGDAVELDLNTSVNALGDRIGAIGMAIDGNWTSDGSWSGTTEFGDTISFSRTHTGTVGSTGTITEIQSITNATAGQEIDIDFTIACTGTLVEDTYSTPSEFWVDNETCTITTPNTSNILKGTGYSLTVSALNVAITDGTATSTFTMSGNVTGDNSASMTLTSLTASAKIKANTDTVVGTVENISFLFDGTVVAGGKTLTGKLNLSEADPTQNYISGKFEGNATDPVITGKISAILSLDQLKGVIDDSDNQYDEQPITLFQKSDGTYLLVTRAVEHSYNEYSTAWDSNTYDKNVTYTLQDGSTVECLMSEEKTWTTETVTLASQCDTAGTIHELRDGYKVQVDIGNGTIGYLQYTNINYLCDGTYCANTIVGIDVDLPEDSGEWASFYYDTYNQVWVRYINYPWSQATADFSITGFQKATLFEDIASEMTVEGSITHGENTFTATLGMKRDPLTKTTQLYAKNLDISLGSSNYFKATTLSGSMRDNKYDAYRSYVSYAATGTMDSLDWDQYEAIRWGNTWGEEPAGADITGLDLKLSDINGQTLQAKADLKFSSSDDRHYDLTFNGTYGYLSSSFEGLIDFDAIELVDTSKDESATIYTCTNSYGVTETWWDYNPSLYDNSYSCDSGVVQTWARPDKFPVGTAKVKGVFTPGNGFAPFSIEMVATTTATSAGGTIFFSRTLDQVTYYLAMKASVTNMFDDATRYTVFNLGDSKGVKATFTTTGQTQEDALTEINFTDNAATPNVLGTLTVKDTTTPANEGMVTFTDGSESSIF